MQNGNCIDLPNINTQEYPAVLNNVCLGKTSYIIMQNISL